MCNGVFIPSSANGPPERPWGNLVVCVSPAGSEVLLGELGNGQQAANEYLAAGCHHEC